MQKAESLIRRAESDMQRKILDKFSVDSYTFFSPRVGKPTLELRWLRRAKPTLSGSVLISPSQLLSWDEDIIAPGSLKPGSLPSAIAWKYPSHIQAP